MTPRGSAAALAAMMTCMASPAWGAGLYFGDRGVRPLGRGGAFVAGADDGGSVAYNPAGLAFTGHAYLGDFAWLNYSSTYQRKQRIRQFDPNTGQPTGQEWTETYDPVEGRTPILPIPTAVYSNPLGVEDANFAIGVWAPYAAITSFPEQVNGKPAPQRYSLITLDGSALAVIGVYGSYRPSKEIALGAGVEMLTGYFQTSVYFSAAPPESFISAPENPSYDAYGQLRVGPIFAPSGIIGAILVPSDAVRIGGSFHLPFWVDAPGTQKVRLPSAPIFEQASVSGENVNVKFNLPWVARLGVEIRAVEQLRLEAGLAYEAWAMHDKITVTSNDLALEGVAGFPPVYKIPPLSIDRGFRNTYSVRAGGEYRFPISSYALGLRSGVSYEKSAIPKEYLSASTIDLDKVTFSVGGSLYLGKWRFDGVIARVIGTPVEVGVNEQRVHQLNPVLANAAEYPNYVNAGKYSASANVLGVGLVYQFDAPDEPNKAKPKPAAPAPAPETKPAAEDVAPEKPEKPEKKADEDSGAEDFEKAFEKETEKQETEKAKPKPKGKGKEKGKK
jgi:long-chain fatty acid transport protein